MFERWRNPGKQTYDGTKMLSDLAGLSIEETRWIAARTHALIREGKTATEAKNIVKLEAVQRPWLVGKVPQRDDWR
jgi:hypothetical protein